MMTANRKKDKNRKDRCSKAGLLDLREKRGVKGMTSSWPFMYVQTGEEWRSIEDRGGVETGSGRCQ